MITSCPRILLSRCSKSTLAAGLAALLLPCPVVSGIRQFPEANVIRGKTAGGHPYLNGGISFGERRAIERAAHLYNLKIVFARPLGALTSPVFLLIGFNSGRHVEKISLRAPWFYIQLPPGGYTILARFKRQVVLVKDVDLREELGKTYLLRGD